MVNWILKAYYWFWHDVCNCSKPFSWLIVEHIKAHLIAWDLIGGSILVIIWFLVIHFIAMA